MTKEKKGIEESKRLFEAALKSFSENPRIPKAWKAAVLGQGQSTENLCLSSEQFGAES